VLTTLLDGTAFAERFGSGQPAVVALHGWARNRSDWTATLEGYDALALDLPGFGATPAPEEAWGSEEYAAWAARIIQELDRPVVVGHSFGGRVAVQLAARYADLLSGVVLTGVPLYKVPSTGKPSLTYRLGRALHAKGLIPEARMEALRQRYGSEDYRNARGVMRDVLVRLVNEDYTAEIAAIAPTDLPIRMVWGEHDTAAPTWMPEQALATLNAAADHAALEVVGGSAHLLDAGLVTALRSAIDELKAA